MLEVSLNSLRHISLLLKVCNRPAVVSRAIPTQQSHLTDPSSTGPYTLLSLSLGATLGQEVYLSAEEEDRGKVKQQSLLPGPPSKTPNREGDRFQV